MRAFAIFQLATSVWASDVIVLVIGHPLLYILQIYILYFSFLIFDFCASGSSGFSSADTLQHISLENCFRLLVLSNFFCLSLSFYFILFIYFVVFFFVMGSGIFVGLFLAQNALNSPIWLAVWRGKCARHSNQRHCGLD